MHINIKLPLPPARRTPPKDGFNIFRSRSVVNCFTGIALVEVGAGDCFVVTLWRDASQ